MNTNKTLRPLISIVIIVAIIIGCISFFRYKSLFLAKYYYYKGYSKQNSKNLEGAINDFTQVLKYDKKNIATYISRGSAYLDLKKYNEAIHDYSIVISQAPNDPRAYAYRGRAYYEIADTIKSIIDYDKAIDLDNKFGYAYLNRGILKYTLLSYPQGGCIDLTIALKLGEPGAKELLEEGHCNSILY